MLEFLGSIFVIFLTWVVLICTMMFFTSALWIAFKIMGIDVDGFTV